LRAACQQFLDSPLAQLFNREFQEAVEEGQASIVAFNIDDEASVRNLIRLKEMVNQSMYIQEYFVLLMEDIQQELKLRRK